MDNVPNTKERKNGFFTVPNILTVLRLCLIPVIVYVYCFKGLYLLTLGFIILSAMTDVVDGFIARKFNLISNVGKIMDPIADKLTQIAVMGCLVTRFWYIAIPLALLVIKELFAGIVVLVAINKSGVVDSSMWHGKMCTVLLYGVIALHAIWYEIPQTLSFALVLTCVGIMIMSAVLYAIMMFGKIKNSKKNKTV